MITTKERARRFGVRLKTLFNIPEYHDFTYKVNGKTKRDKKFYFNNIPVKIPNFWYDPFELYVLAHIQRAHFIMTCNQWAYVDSAVSHLDGRKIVLNSSNSPVNSYSCYTFVGTIHTKTLNNSVFAKTTSGKIIEIKEDENTNTQTESNN
jgi:hypothetical protein